MSIFATILLILAIHYIVGIGVIFFISNEVDDEGGAHWCIIYAFGPFIWPFVLISYLKHRQKL